MNALTESQHNEFAELLPDFAIGALSDGDLWRVEAHLDRCDRCQAEFARLLDAVSVIAPSPPPSAAARRSLFERAGHPLPERAPPPERQLGPVQRETRIQPSTIRRFPARLAWAALPAAAVVLLLLGGWNLWLQRELDDREDLAALFTEPGIAYQLTDSEVPTDASAVIHVDPRRDLALLTAQDLPPLADDERYQVWLFTENGERIDGGSFAPEEDGSAVAAVEAPDTFGTYWAVAVSAEPDGDSDAPTSPLLLGGWIQ